MKKLQSWFSANRMLALLLCALLAGFVAFSVARYQVVHAPKQQTQQEQADTPEAKEKQAENKADKDLPASSRKLREDYSDTTEDFIAHLRAYAWVSGDESTIVTFTRKNLIVAQSGKQKRYAYVVRSLDTQTTTADDGQSPATVLVADFETGDGDYIVQLTTVSARNADGTQAQTSQTLVSELFGMNKTFSPGYVTTEIELDGPDNDWFKAAGTTKKKVSQAVSEWCATNAPTATTATWSQQAAIDYSGKTTTLTYKLNNKNKTQITVSIEQGDNHKISITEGM